MHGGFVSYYACHAHESVEVLTAYHDYLDGILNGGKDGQIDYYHRISALGRGGRVNDHSFGEGNAANSPEDRQRPDVIAAFGERIASLKQEEVYVRNDGRMIPWAEAAEPHKLALIFREAQVVSPPDAACVTGAVALEAVEREINYAELLPVQREMLLDLRTQIDAGQLAGQESPGGADRAWLALGRIAGVGEFESMLEPYKTEVDVLPWSALAENVKVRVLLDLAQVAGPPGEYTLAAIEREVDYAKLPSWRRTALEAMRDRVDRQELHGEHPNPGFLCDRVDYALRITELEARIEDARQFGITDREANPLKWSEASNVQKLDFIEYHIEDLHLGSEPKAYEFIDREVDRFRLPPDRKFKINCARFEALAPGPARDDAAARDAFEKATADLPRHWQENAFSGGLLWEDHSAEEHIDYLAGLAAEHGVPFAQFHEAAGRTLGLEPGQVFSADEQWHLRHQFRNAHEEHAGRRDEHGPRSDPRAPADANPRLAQLTAGAERERHAIAFYRTKAEALNRNLPTETPAEDRVQRLAELAICLGLEQEVFAQAAHEQLGGQVPTPESVAMTNAAWAKEAAKGGPAEAFLARQSVHEPAGQRSFGIAPVAPDIDMDR